MKHQPAAAPANNVLRILSCNILAGASVKRYHEYFTRSWGAVLPGKYKLGNLDNLARSIAQGCRGCRARSEEHTSELQSPA